MPHIRARGIEQSALEEVAGSIVEQFAKLTDTPNDHFTVEHIASQFIVAGGASSAYPFVEVLWFDRGQDVKTAVAHVINTALRPFVGEDKDITVLFEDLNGNDYYENREHF